MADYLTLATLAENLNDALNTISAELDTASTIDRNIPFNIVEDIQYYEDDKSWSDTVVVPGIMIRLAGRVAPSQVHQSYTDTVTVTVYAFKRELEDAKKVINTYIERNTGKFVKSNGWVYQLEFERPTIIDRGIDEGEERVTIILDITYNFIYNGYTSDDITVKFNAVEVPVLSYVHKMIRISNTNDDLANAGEVKHRPTKSTITKTISFVHINNTEINKVLSDIDRGDELTRTYTVFYGIGYDTGTTLYDYDKSQTMTILEGDIQFIEGGFQIINVTLGLYNELS